MKNKRVRQLVITGLILFAIGAISLVAAAFLAGIDTITPKSNEVTLAPAVQVHPSTTEKIEPTMDLEGVWFFQSPKGGVFEATITTKNIKILMKTPDDVSLVYWNGTFESRQIAGATVTSQVNEDAFILSKSTSKEFKVGEDTLTFDYTQAGMTKKVELRRV